MQPFPHHYQVIVSADDHGNVTVSSDNLASMDSGPPMEYGGPGNLWSPETLTVAAVVDCFTLTFRAIAAASRFTWKALSCRGNGTVDRIEGVTRFTGIHIVARLTVPEGTGSERAQTLLEKAEKTCLVGQSLRFEPTLETEIVVG